MARKQATHDHLVGKTENVVWQRYISNKYNILIMYI